MDDIESYWDVRGRIQGPDALLETNMPELYRWGRTVGEPGSRPYVVVRGLHRDMVYTRLSHDEALFDDPGRVVDLVGGATDAWVLDGPGAHLRARAKGLTLPFDVLASRALRDRLPGLLDKPWEILGGLITTPAFQLGPTLAAQTDRTEQPFADLVERVATARARLRTDVDVYAEVRALGVWLDRASPELLCFLLTLARQNGVVGRVVLTLDRVELITTFAIAAELVALVALVERWADLGSPLGLVLGWRGAECDRERLQSVCPALVKTLDRGSLGGVLVAPARHEHSPEARRKPPSDRPLP